MSQFLALAIMLIALVQPGRNYVVRLKITAVPSDSFRMGNSVTLKATFAKEGVVPLSPVCKDQGFVLRIYDASKVPNDGVRHVADSNHPITPYLQETVAPYQPLSGPNTMTIEKTFEPFVIRTTGKPPRRLYLGLFRACGAAIGKDHTDTIIYYTPLDGGFLHGTYFRFKCTGGQCAFRQE